MSALSDHFWTFYWTQTGLDFLLGAGAFLGVIAWQRTRR
jgi:hypothetical protein